MTRTVYGVTHPEATHHVDRLVGGWYDSELTERGRAEAGRIAHRLRELIPAGEQVALYSSDLRRTMQTAAPVADLLGVEIRAVVGLREKSYGVAGGRPQAWLDERFIVPPATGERLDHDEGIDGSETKLEWVRRVYRAVEQIEQDPAPHRIVVTHGGSINWVVAAWLRIPVAACDYASFRVDSGSITVLTEDDRFHNRTLHTLGERPD